MSHVRNTWIERSRGEYIVFVDNDDVLPYYAVELYVSKMADGSVDVVQGNIGAWNNNQSDLENKEGNDEYKVVPIEEFVKKEEIGPVFGGRCIGLQILKNMNFQRIIIAKIYTLMHYCLQMMM